MPADDDARQRNRRNRNLSSFHRDRNSLDTNTTLRHARRHGRVLNIGGSLRRYIGQHVSPWGRRNSHLGLSYLHCQLVSPSSMDHTERQRTGSVASISNANVIADAEAKAKPSASWLERKLRPTKINARYPIKGKALLFATCGFGSLGDALFGYNSGRLLMVEHVLYVSLTPLSKVLCLAYWSTRCSLQGSSRITEVPMAPPTMSIPPSPASPSLVCKLPRRLALSSLADSAT